MCIRCMICCDGSRAEIMCVWRQGCEFMRTVSVFSPYHHVKMCSTAGEICGVYIDQPARFFSWPKCFARALLLKCHASCASALQRSTSQNRIFAAESLFTYSFKAKNKNGARNAFVLFKRKGNLSHYRPTTPSTTCRSYMVYCPSRPLST